MPSPYEPKTNSVRSILVGWGGTGKTGFGMTMPKPLVWIECDPGSFDRGFPGYKQRHSPNKAINVLELEMVQGYTEKPAKDFEGEIYLYRCPNIPVADMGEDVYIQYVDDIIECATSAMKQDFIKSVVIDSASNLWTMVHRSSLEDVKRRNPSRQNITQIEYADANAKMQKLFTESRISDTNLLMLFSERETRFVNQDQSVTEITPYNWRHAEVAADVFLQSYMLTKGRKPRIELSWAVEILASKIKPTSVNLNMETPTWNDFWKTQQ